MKLFFYIILFIIIEINLFDINYDNDLYSFYNSLNKDIIINYSNLNYKIFGINFIALFCKFNNMNLIMNDILTLNISHVNFNLVNNDDNNNYYEDKNIMIINRNVSNNIVNRVDYFIYDNNGEIMEMENKKIEVIKPMINDEYIKKYKYTEEKGYNISDKEIKLYNDRCEYYSNEDDKDVNMKDRREYYLGIFCEDNCNIKNINFNELKIECECFYQSKSNLQNIINNFNQEIKINDEEIKFSNNFNNINFSLIKCKIYF